MGKRRRPPEWHPLHSPSKSAKAVARREAEQKAAADVAAKMARRDCLFGSWYLRDRRRKKVAKEVPLDNQGDRVVDLCSDENEAQAAEGFWEALAGDDDFVCCKEWCNEHYGSDEDGDVERFSPQLVSDFRRYYYGLPPQDRAEAREPGAAPAERMAGPAAAAAWADGPRLVWAVRARLCSS